MESEYVMLERKAKSSRNSILTRSKDLQSLSDELKDAAAALARVLDDVMSLRSIIWAKREEEQWKMKAKR